MPTLIEQKVDILIYFADRNCTYIPSEVFADPLPIQSLWAELASYMDVRVMLFQKIKIADILKLYQQAIFTDDDFITLFIQPTFSKARVIDILKQLDFDHRKRLIQHLIEKDPDRFLTIEDELDTKYGLVAGMLVKDISKKVNYSHKALYNLLTDMLDQPESSLDTFKQYADSVVRNHLDASMEFIHDILKLKGDLFKDSTLPVSSQDEFAQLVKLAYLLCLNDTLVTHYQDSIDILKSRISRSLYLFSDSDAICLILTQLPEFLIKAIYHDIEHQCLVKDMELRNQAVQMKNLILEGCKTHQYLNLKVIEG